MIFFSHVSKKYNDFYAVQDVSFEIPKGLFVTVIGSSGCGKTTLLKMINALLVPDEGEILINGENIAEMDKIDLRRNIGYAIQEVGLFPHMSVRKNIAYVPGLSKRWDREEEKRETEKLAEMVGLDKELLNRYPSELSGGQRQRVGLARALAVRPGILLMDEAFSAADEITRKYLQDEIKRIHEEMGMNIIFVTHDVKEALKLGDITMVMDKGRLIQQGTEEELRERPVNEFVRKLVRQGE
ncbi:MAG: ABC transporter ATP-binding protein [Lachnospiraceae bacterium]